jgi:integrase/recombinase XerD
MDNESLVEEFLKDIRLRGWSQWTIKSCGYTLKLFQECIGNTSFLEVNKEELKSFLFFLKARKGRGDEISQETLRKHINNLSSFYEYLEDEECIPKSPIPQFRRKYVRNSFRDAHKGQKRQIIDVVQMRKLIGSILDPHDRAMFMLLAKTGLRAQELISIDVSDVSLENMSISLKPTGKRKNMLVFFDFETKALLTRWLELRKEIAKPDEKALFVTNEGNRMSNVILNKRLKRYAELIGVHDPDSSDLQERFTTHCFRHFFTTELINAGMPRDFVKELRGDSRSETIDIYRHITVDELKREYLERMPKLIL